MNRVKISILVEVEYDLDPKNYPLENTIEEMIALDVDGAEQDPYLFMEMEGAKITVTGEIVN